MEGYRSTYCGNLARKLKLRHLEECKYFPKYFTIETCNNCNARCIMCPKGAGGGEGDPQFTIDGGRGI